MKVKVRQLETEAETLAKYFRHKPMTNAETTATEETTPADYSPTGRFLATNEPAQNGRFSLFWGWGIRFFDVFRAKSRRDSEKFALRFNPENNIFDSARRGVYRHSRLNDVYTTRFGRYCSDCRNKIISNPMSKLYFKLAFFWLVFTGTAFAAEAQQATLTAVDDNIYTGPLQTVKKNIIHNDIIPGDYTWEITSPLLIPEGTLTQQGDFLVFTPAPGISNTVVDVTYKLSSSSNEDESDATVHIFVSEYNNPVNIIDPDLDCVSTLPENIQFGIKLKYQTSPRASSGNWIDGYTSPLVGDLNGDGKPEIVIMGANGTSGGSGADFRGRYINIYNGQNGERLVHYDFMSLEGTTLTGYGEMDIADAYHRPPAVMALADLDNDGLGEIVFCHANSGRVAAFKPVLNAAGAITDDLTRMWEGRDQNNNIVSYKAPLSASLPPGYTYPQPAVADLDGDGIPEVIVYNKIFNGQTGKLLMSWRKPVSTPTASSITAADGLHATSSTNPISSANAAALRDHALTGRRAGNSASFSNRYLSVPAIVDIDNDDNQEIITGSYIYKFDLSDKEDHTKNKYYTITGPLTADVHQNTGSTSSNLTDYHFSDGFTRVADVDGDGDLDIIVATYGDNGAQDCKVVLYVWELNSTKDGGILKACVSFRSDGYTGASFGIPFIGDINGEEDGYDDINWTRKLPEICIIGGAMYINRSTANDGRTGVKFHPSADYNLTQGVDNNNTSSPRKFNRANSSSLRGHIIGLTYDASATDIEDRLKVSFGMEHNDPSAITGMTLFDFDNNGTADICYRDETSLRVISPRYANGGTGNDYITINQSAPADGIMFRQPTGIQIGTGAEYPTIADVNMDGSADIVVTNASGLEASHGWIEVYEYDGAMWAPCPPVWNQGMYDPTQVREDLKINARPPSMLTPYTKTVGGVTETIYPLNGSWVQQPIVTQDADYVPVVRKPDVNILDMKVVISGGDTKVTLVIRNDGSASINSQTPITFYDGDLNGYAIDDPSIVTIGTQTVGVDIFPGETDTTTYTLTGSYANKLIWVRITDNGTDFPDPSYLECELPNNVFSGTSCIPPHLLNALPDTVLCGDSDNVTLEVVFENATDYSCQWSRNGITIPGETGLIYVATSEGNYRCFITEGLVCRGNTEIKTITRETPVAENDTLTVEIGTPKALDVLANDDTKSVYCNPYPIITEQPTQGTATVQADGTILYTPNPSDPLPCADSLDYTLGDNTAKVYLTIKKKSVIAVDDHVTVFENSNNKIAVTLNDIKNCTGDTTINISAGAKHGTATVEDTLINYTPTAGYLGFDSVIYRIYCDEGVDSATLYINVIEKPDNIIDADCYTTPPAQAWSIREENTTLGEISTYAPPLVGDLNGDGYPEIVAPYEHGTITGTSPSGLDGTHRAQQIKIYRGGTFAERVFSTEVSFAPVMTGVIALVRTKINSKDTALIVVAEADLKLRAYNHAGGLVWESSDTWRATGTSNSETSVGVADFNGDGNPEIYTGNRIFNASDGTWLCTGTGNAGRSADPNLGHAHDMTIAADIFGTGRLNLVAGNQVYEVAQNFSSMTVVASVSPPVVTGVTVPADGLTQVIDIDNDGKLEVVVEHHFSGADIIYIWSPAKQQVLAQKYFSSPNKMGVPFMGDVDGDKKPEILFIATDSIYAFKYVEGNPLLQRFWGMKHDDGSAMTGMTLFDFNQDGKAEIVYRDESHLRIIDGSTSSPQTLKDYQCSSGTGYEYPVVADIDNDGAAEILIAGNDGAPGVPNGKLRIFKSGGSEKWAPARKVWNQYAYNVVNVNEDLTIPAVQMNPAITFPGADGILGTADDIRPYNAFLQQATALSVEGTPLWLIPDASFTGDPVINHYADGDSLVITLQVTNTGDAALSAPFYITTYKNTVVATNKMATDSSTVAVNAGETKPVTVTVRNLSSWLASPALTKIVFRVNDKGEATFPVQPECNNNNNTLTYPLEDILMARNDTATTITVTPVKIPVLKNDIIPASCTIGTHGIVKNPAHGTAEWNSTNDSIIYTSTDPDFSGHDTLVYSIACGNNSSTARVYIIVYDKPDNIVEQEDCFVPAAPITFGIREQYRVAGGAHIKNIPLVGDLDGDGIPEIVTFGSTSADYNYFRVMNVYDGSTKQLKKSIDIAVITNGAWISPVPAVLVNSDGNKWGEIIITTPSYHLHSYEAGVVNGVFTLTDKWGPSGILYDHPTGSDASTLPQPFVTDFNGDGTPELVVYNQIFNANTGALMGTTEAIGSAYVGISYPGATFITAADFDGDGLPELVAGAAVYKVTITGQTATCSILSKNPTIGDGFTAVADIDLDGKLEVVISKRVRVNTTDSTRLYVWRPDIAGGGAGTFKYNTISAHGGGASNTHSFPFVGDIDGATDPVTGKKYPEICLMTINAVTALKYNQGSDTHTQLWKIHTTDVSGGTGITLFDFDNDGASELVYRDETNLRIINGTDGSNTTVRPCASGTAWEYPVIADTDGDGSANICVTCYDKTPSPTSYDLVVFESSTQPWAPTRTVWNQVNYEPLQINEDLTVPKYQLPKNTAFAGKYPYNGALIQVPTMVDNNFTIVQLAADPAADSLWMEELNASTTRIWVRIKNHGVKNTNASLPVSLYNTATPGTGRLATEPVGAIIEPGKTDSMYFDIPSTSVTVTMSVRIQDDGDDFPAPGSYLDCDTDNNTGEISGLLAVRDYMITMLDSVIFNVLDNDFYGSCGKGALDAFDTIVNSGLHHGSLKINPADSAFTYIPAENFLGVDSLSYYIKCGADSSAAKVYILVQKPLSQEYVACEGAWEAMGFELISGVSYRWYDAETGGNLVKSTASDTIQRQKDDTSIQTWWAEASYGTIVFPRYRVDLLMGDCDVTDPQNCAKDGTLLFREDFGGNEVSDATPSTVGLPGTTGYLFNPVLPPTDGEYTLIKHFHDHLNWHNYDDHTIPGTDRGYYMLVNADEEPGLFYTATISGLCPNSKLYFSAWVGNMMKSTVELSKSRRPRLRFVLQDATTNVTLATFVTTDIEPESQPTWKMYGFEFVTNSPDIKLSIYNDAPGGEGNDLTLDDIEIRFCAPEVEITKPVASDTVVCSGSSLVLSGNYTDDGTFTHSGNDLVYRWEYSATGDVNVPTDWTMQGSQQNGASPITSEYTVSSPVEGYYRLVVANADNIGSYNCRAMSRVIRVRVMSGFVAPDIRVQVCPSPPDHTIYLSSFIDSTDYNIIKWAAVTPFGPVLNDVETGKIEGNFMKRYTYTYRYTLKSSSSASCPSTSAKAYVHVLDDRILSKTDTVVICKDLDASKAVNLDQILGLALGGVWEYDNPVNPDNTVSTNVKVYTAPSNYAGAHVFNAQKAYADANTSYDYTYKGIAVKKFVFLYDNITCAGNGSKQIVVIVTD